MAPANLPSVFNATSQDIEMLLAAQTHVGSKNLQVHMNPYLWKTRYVGLSLGSLWPQLGTLRIMLTSFSHSADGVNIINAGKTW